MDWDGLSRWARRWANVVPRKFGPVYRPELAGKGPLTEEDEGWDV